MALSIKKLTFASILMTPLLFVFFIHSSWNNEQRFSPERFKTGDKNKIRFSIDKCTLEGGVIYVSGWAFIDAPPENQKIVITRFQDGEYFAPHLMINNRMDVSKVFNRGNELDHSGFSFSYRPHKIKDESFNINILSKRVLYSESYACH